MKIETKELTIELESAKLNDDSVKQVERIIELALSYEEKKKRIEMSFLKSASQVSRNGKNRKKGKNVN